VTVLLAAGLTIQTSIFLMAAFAWFRSRAYTFAEAAAGAIVTVFIAVSVIHQVGGYIKQPLFPLLFELATLVAIAIYGRRRLGQPLEMHTAAIYLLRQEKFSGLIIAIAWVAMIGMVVKGWFGASHLPPVRPWALLMDASPDAGRFCINTAGPLTSLNTAALFHHATRFGLAPGACGFGLLAHMAVGFSTYALARRYAWPPMAMTVTLLVLCIPRLVFLSVTPTAELISTAAVVFAMLLVYRLVELHRPGDLRLFLLSVLFSIYASPMSIALVPVLILLLGVTMIRRHGWRSLWEMIADRPMITGALLLPAILLAQIPVFVTNRIVASQMTGNEIAFEAGGIIGAAANLVRYLFISCDPTEPVQHMLKWLVGLDLNSLLMGFYQVMMAMFPGQGETADPFALHFSVRGDFGIGPFALILILPAMIHALVRGPRRLKSVSLAWVGYLYLAALVLAWQPSNLSVLCPFYAANGFIVAFSLPAWRLRRRGMRLLQVDFAILMAWTLIACW